MTIDELLAVESIKRQRLLYSYYLDSGDLHSLVELFTEDAVCEFGPYGVWTGKDTFYEKFAEAEKPWYANGYFSNLHAVTNHLVELTGAEAARGRVYLLDFVVRKLDRDDNPLYWLALYDEEYRKVDDIWKIARCSLYFTWPERHLDDAFFQKWAPREA